MNRMHRRFSENGLPTRRRPDIPPVEVAQEEATHLVAAAGFAGKAPAEAFRPLLTLQELSDVLRLHPRTIRRMVAAGRIPCVRLARAIRFDAADVARWLAARKEG